MASKNVATEFNAKIARALKGDAEQRELIGFINRRIADQRALLDCLWVFSMGFSADWDRLEKGEKQRGLAIMYNLFGRAIELAGPLNELADFVLYVAALAHESRGGKWDTRHLLPPSSETREQYAVYQNRWNQMPEQDQNVLRQKAQQKRQEFRNRRTLITEVVNAYQKENKRRPTLEELLDFDPAPNTPRKDFDKAINACEVSWRQFSQWQRSATPPRLSRT